jgi:uncharacterized protein (TIGR02265 family)
MGEQRVVFGTVVESLFLRALKGRMTPALKERVRAEGIDLDRRLAPGYSIEVWARCVDAATELVYPTLKREDAQWRLGEESVRAFAETPLGRVAFGLLKFLNPMTALRRMEQNLRTGNNFVKTRCTELNPTSAELWLSDVHGQPWLTAGTISEGGKLSGAKNLRVEILSTDGTECTYRVSWDAER